MVIVGADLPSSTSTRPYWICQLIGWGLYVVVTAYQFATDQGLSIARALTEPLSAAAFGILLTHMFRRYARQRRWVALGTRALSPRVIGVSIGLAIVFVTVFASVEMGIYGDPPPPALVIAFAVMRWTLLFFVWMALYFGVALLQQRQRAEIHQLQLAGALRTAELRSLKSQLNPHFLFNSLNSVRALIADEPARVAITQLSRILRYALGGDRDEVVLFEHELEIVEDYLGLESLRLGGRLTIMRHIASATHGARIPVMLLQTIVENAIKHGIAQMPAGGTLRISASRAADGALHVEVENPRPALPNRDIDESPGIGLANASERLRLLVGGEATLHLDLAVPGRATTTVRIPQQA